MNETLPATSASSPLRALFFAPARLFKFGEGDATTPVIVSAAVWGLVAYLTVRKIKSRRR